MNANPGLRTLEIRNYLLKPGMRERFIEYFESHFIDSQNVLGGYVLGQFRVKGEQDKFLWMRGFEDMRARFAFLRSFYEEGATWKEFGAGANQMMVDSDNVHLLKSLNQESFNGSHMGKEMDILVIDFYRAKEQRFDALVDIFQKDYLPSLVNKPTLWISEMTTNDFPRLPVIQDRNLLVAISAFQNESEYLSQMRHSAESKSRWPELLADTNCLIVYPTARAIPGNS